MFKVLVYTHRRQKDIPVLMDSQIEEIQQRDRLEKIQAYRLVRDNVLEHQKQQELNRKKLMRHQLEMYESMQVSHNRNTSMWLAKLSAEGVGGNNKRIWLSRGNRVRKPFCQRPFPLVTHHSVTSPPLFVLSPGSLRAAL